MVESFREVLTGVCVCVCLIVGDLETSTTTQPRPKLCCFVTEQN